MIPRGDFDRYARAARSAWARELNLIRFDGGTEQQRVVAASALYHASIGPTLFSDVDGRYVGLDRQTHTLPRTELARMHPRHEAARDPGFQHPA